MKIDRTLDRKGASTVYVAPVPDNEPLNNRIYNGLDERKGWPIIEVPLKREVHKKNYTPFWDAIVGVCLLCVAAVCISMVMFLVHRVVSGLPAFKLSEIECNIKHATNLDKSNVHTIKDTLSCGTNLTCGLGDL